MVVGELAAGLRLVGHVVRLDEERAGDSGWWAGVLAGVQATDAVVSVMSWRAASSPVCRLEREYAVGLGVPVVEVRLEPLGLPGGDDDRVVDYRSGDAGSAFRLVGVIAKLPGRSVAGWQPVPGAPFSGMDDLVRAVLSGDPGGAVEMLREAADRENPGAVGELAAVLRRRSGLDDDVVRRLNSAFPSRRDEIGEAPAAGVPAGMLSEDAVRAVTFRRPGLGRRGYDERSVDEFLDQVEADLRARRAAWERPAADSVPVVVAMTSADVRAAQFAKPSFGARGYDEEDVDTFLDEVERSFTVLDAELGRRGARITRR